MLYCKPKLPLHVEGLQALEERADWKTAADSVRQVIAETSQEHFTSARVEETAAYFLIRASLQAEQRVDFDRTVAEAIASLVRASEHYQGSGVPSSRIFALVCQARAQFLLAWTSPTPSSRHRLLLQAYTSLWERSEEIDQLDDVELQYTALGDLLLYALEWSNTVPFSAVLADSLVSLINHVDKFLKSSPSRLPEERARVLCLASQLARQAAFWTQANPAQVELGTRAVKFARLSQEANGSDPFLTGVVDAILGQTLADFESAPQLEENLWRSALKAGLELNDRYLTALSSSLLCYNMAWKLSEEEEPEQAGRFAEECLRLGDEAVRNGSIIRFCHAVSSTQAGAVTNAYYLLAMSEPDRAKRRSLREKAVETARSAMASAKASGCLLDISNSYHSLSKSIEASCLEEYDDRLKRRALTEALALRRLSVSTIRRAAPPGTWTHGVQFHYLATLLSQLATLDPRKTNMKLLSRALSASTTCLKYCSATAVGSEARERYWLHLAEYLESHAKLLEKFHSETGKRIFLENALSTYKRAGLMYGERGLFGRSASALWHCGNLSHFLGAHADSGREFDRSAECYTSQEKEIPNLSAYFHGLVSYMNAWSKVEEAHQAHAKGEYGSASEHYRRAATLLEHSDRGYLSTSFLAWASLENADYLSRGEMLEKSSAAFQEASILFQKCQREISGRLAGIENPEERLVAKKIVAFSDSYDSYCRARTLFDQARLEELRGDYASASRLHDRTAKLLESTLQGLPVEERSDLLLSLDLARGWSLLCAARAAQDPTKYLKAATLFRRAAEESSNARVSQYAMGNRFLAEALASESRFARRGDPRFYREAKRRLRNASICYSSANMDRSSLAVDARLSLLDASLYATKAESSTDPVTRTRGLSLAEKCLRHALQFYQKAADSGSQREVEQLLRKVIERRRLGKMLRGTLQHPVVASPASLFSRPSHGPESAVGITEVEQRYVHGQIGLPQEVSDDEPFTVTLDLVNVGNQPVSLLQLKDFLPPPVKIVKMLSDHSIQDGSVELTGKRLQPRGVESISIECLAAAGLIEFRPRIVYLDGLGRPKSHQVAATTRHALSHATFEFESPTSGAVFRFLASQFVQDYMVRHLAAEGSGWRSFPTIVKQVGVPMSAAYSPRGLGSPLAELVRRGIVEVKVFLSQPGRGGRVQRARVCYEKNPVRVFVDRLTMKTSEKQKPSF